MPNDLMTQGQIEVAIGDLEDQLEAATETYDKAAREAADAETRYRVRRARSELAMKDQHHCSDRAAENRATVMIENELRDRNMKAAIERSARIAWETKRSRLDAMRTRAANVRHQT